MMIPIARTRTMRTTTKMRKRETEMKTKMRTGQDHLVNVQDKDHRGARNVERRMTDE
jgi:hypothetical protein